MKKPPKKTKASTTAAGTPTAPSTPTAAKKSAAKVKKKLEESLFTFLYLFTFKSAVLFSSVGGGGGGGGKEGQEGAGVRPLVRREGGPEAVPAPGGPEAETVQRVQVQGVPSPGLPGTVPGGARGGKFVYFCICLLLKLLLHEQSLFTFCTCLL